MKVDVDMWQGFEIQLKMWERGEEFHNCYPEGDNYVPKGSDKGSVKVKIRWEFIQSNHHLPLGKTKFVQP